MSDSLQLLFVFHKKMASSSVLCFKRKWLQVQCCVSSESGFKFSVVFHKKMASSSMLCFIRNMAMRVLRLIISLFIMAATLYIQK